MGIFICTDNLKMHTDELVDNYMNQIPISRSLSLLSYTSKNPAIPGG